MTDSSVPSKKSRSQTPKSFATLDPDELTRLALEAACITPEELGIALRKAFNRHKELLDATKKTVKVIDGEPVEIETPDNRTRMDAVQSLYDLTGTRRTKERGPSVEINLNLPDYFQDQKVIDVSSPKNDK